jgi:hypothetical protein
MFSIMYSLGSDHLAVDVTFNSTDYQSLSSRAHLTPPAIPLASLNIQHSNPRLHSRGNRILYSPTWQTHRRPNEASTSHWWRLPSIWRYALIPLRICGRSEDPLQRTLFLQDHNAREVVLYETDVAKSARLWCTRRKVKQVYATAMPYGPGVTV